jgi:glycosyltransferase involved in cell wall biosynthesis
MIVKNESQRLPTLLRSLSAICEQTVVVDTGSTDNTAQLAREMGAEVGFFPWNDSFSDARNASLEMARHPWILYADADDLLDEEALLGIKDLKKIPPDRAFGFVIKSTQDGVTGMASSQIRMFPNTKGVRFRYRVHEQIRPSLVENGIPINFTGIEILHMGYTDRETVTVKQKRNLALLEKDLEDFPDDGFLYYVAGMGWVDLNQKDKAKQALQQAWSLSSTNPEQGHIALGAALELAELILESNEEDSNEATLWVERAEGIDRNYPQCLYLRSLLYQEKGDINKMLHFLGKLVACEAPDHMLPIDMPILKSKAAALMAQIYMQTGRSREAVSILERAQEMLKNPTAK